MHACDRRRLSLSLMRRRGDAQTRALLTLTELNETAEANVLNYARSNMTGRINCRRRFDERRLRSSHNTRDETMEHVCNASLCLRPLDLVFNTSSQPRRELIYTVGYGLNFVKCKINTSIASIITPCMSDDGDFQLLIPVQKQRTSHSGQCDGC